MKKCALIMGLLLVAIGCSSQSAVRNSELEQSVVSAMADTGTEAIDLNDHARFAWEQAYIFSPYTSREKIERQIGTSYEDQSRIEVREDIHLIVFVHRNEVIEYAEISRQYGDLHTDSDGAITPSAATVTIKRH